MLAVRVHGLRLQFFDRDDHKNNGILVILDRISLMVHLDVVFESIMTQVFALFFIDTIFRLRGLTSELEFDRDPRCTEKFW